MKLCLPWDIVKMRVHMRVPSMKALYVISLPCSFWLAVLIFKQSYFIVRTSDITRSFLFSLFPRTTSWMLVHTWSRLRLPAEEWWFSSVFGRWAWSTFFAASHTGPGVLDGQLRWVSEGSHLLLSEVSVAVTNSCAVVMHRYICKCWLWSRVLDFKIIYVD